MKFAIAIYVVAVAALAYSQPITIAAKQSNRPSPPTVVSSGIQRPQPPVKTPTQQVELIPSITSTPQESIAQPPKEVIITQRPNVNDMIINKSPEYLNTVGEILRPNQQVVEIINQIPNIKEVDIESLKPQQGTEYFNGKVIHEPHYPTRY